MSNMPTRIRPEAVSDLSFRAPDPDSLGRIRNVVRSAHKWGGDGRKPLFRKIRRVLLQKHPEVIAKAFGGNANVAAAWIKNNWYRMRGQEPPPTRGKRKKVSASLALSRDTGYLEVPRDVFGENAAELFCALEAPSKQENLVWVTALRTGEWRVNPIPGKKGPLVVDRAFMDDIMEAWQGNAWEYVQVPTYHTDTDTLANTGFVRDLRVVPDPDRNGEYLLRAAVEFTEPEIAERVLRGSIAGVSVNVKFNVQHQETGKLFRKVLTHVALTNIPFINGLRAFERMLAAERPEDTNGDVLMSYEYDNDLTLRNFSEEERKRLADQGKALPDGSFPIVGVQDLRNAISAFGRAGNKAAAKRHIIKRARALGRTDLLPEEWSASLEEVEMDEVQWAAVAEAWNPTLDYSYVREQIASQLSSGYVLDDEGDLAERIEGDPRTPARVFVMGMSADQVLLTAHSERGDDVARPDVMEENGDARGWLAGYDIGLEGEVIVDPLDEWVEVQKKWVELSREGLVLFRDDDTLPIGVGMQREDENLEGGDSMADETAATPTTPEVTPTREEAERLADERAQAALQAYREEQEQRQQARDAELAAARRQLHELTVREQVQALEDAGHAPAIVALAREYMLADAEQEPALTLSREGEESRPSVTEIVTELLAAFPETALSKTTVELPEAGKAPDSDSVNVRADKVLEFINAD